MNRSAAFLSRLSGVRNVYTSQQLLQLASSAQMEKLRNAFNLSRSGDLIVEASAGWRLINETTGERTLQRESFLAFPLIFFGAGVDKQIINTPVEIDRLAPTLGAHMRIRAPNACGASPLTLTND